MRSRVYKAFKLQQEHELRVGASVGFLTTLVELEQLAVAPDFDPEARLIGALICRMEFDLDVWGEWHILKFSVRSIKEEQKLSDCPVMSWVG